MDSTTAQPTAPPERTSPDRPRIHIPDLPVPGMTNPPPGAGVGRYAEQDVRWQTCTQGDQEFQCADVLAPLDWAEPDTRAVTLFMVRIPATKQPRRGAIFVNPGGPGEPGSLLAPRFHREGLEDYDIVGWDPRGTGQSTPVRCADPKELDRFFETDVSPDDPGERQELIDVNREFGEACVENSGRLLEHISTPDSVADLDLLRQLVGEERLNYFGYSYGTDLGSRYADTYPDRVGRMALDGAINVTDADDVTQATGFDRALSGFAEWCVAQRCSLGGDPQAVERSVTGLFDRLDAQPLAVGDRVLTESLGMTGVIVMLYGAEDEWRMLLSGVERARDGDGALLLQLADFYNARRDGTYDTRPLAFSAIRCLDRGDEGLAGADRRLAEETARAPVLARYLGPDYVCPTWPVPPIAQPRPVQATGSAPILVIGTTGDPATPFEFAENMASQLDSGVLLTYEGAGHGAYGGKSSCVDAAVARYFTSPEAPRPQTCR